MLRVDPSAGTFTTQHTHFLRFCLDGRDLRAALPILDKDIHSFPADAPPDDLYLCSDHYVSNTYITLNSGFTNKITVQTVMEYYLLGATIYIGLRNWSRALLFLEHVLCMPTHNAASLYMVEAYRKWTLVGLLVDGSVGFSGFLCILHVTYYKFH